MTNKDLVHSLNAPDSKGWVRLTQGTENSAWVL